MKNIEPNFKKIIILFHILVLLIIIFPNFLIINAQDTQSFSDVPKGSTFYEFVENLKSEGVVSGFSDGTFKPDNFVTRGEMSKFVVKSLGIATNTNCQAFTDVPKTNTFFNEITTLKCNGIVSGFGNNIFRPEGQVTRGEVSKFIDLSLNGKPYKTLDTKPQMIQGSLVALAKKGNGEITDSSFIDPKNPAFTECKEYYLLQSDASEIANSSFCSNIHNLVIFKLFNSKEGSEIAGNNFKPLQNISRGEMSKVVFRAKQLSDWAKTQSANFTITNAVRYPDNNCSIRNFSTIAYAVTGDRFFSFGVREPLIFDGSDVDGISKNRSAFDNFISELESESISQVPAIFSPNCQNTNHDKLYRQVLPITWLGSTRSKTYIEADRTPEGKVHLVIRSYARKPDFVFYAEYGLLTEDNQSTRAADLTSYNLCVERATLNAGNSANPTLIKSDCVVQEYIVPLGGVQAIEKKAQEWISTLDIT
jgi:hypothetical protein